MLSSASMLDKEWSTGYLKNRKHFSSFLNTEKYKLKRKELSEKDLSKQFTVEEMQRTYVLMKICSTSVVLREIQIIT